MGILENINERLENIEKLMVQIMGCPKDEIPKTNKVSINDAVWNDISTRLRNALYWGRDTLGYDFIDDIYDFKRWKNVGRKTEVEFNELKEKLNIK